MTIVSIYKFRSVEAADAALEALWRRLAGGFERSAGAEIWVNNFCDDITLAGRICQDCGGYLK